MAGTRVDRLAVACVLLALGTVGARADPLADERCTREDAQSAAAPEPDGIAAEAVHALPAVTVESPPLPTPASRRLWPVQFVEHFVDHLDLVTRLRAIRRLKIVPVFDNARVTIFFGLDRRGVAGLHVEPQDGGDLPLFARNAPLAEPPPLRAVPLRSP